jgi:hypothetical protein
MNLSKNYLVMKNKLKKRKKNNLSVLKISTLKSIKENSLQLLVGSDQEKQHFYLVALMK